MSKKTKARSQELNREIGGIFGYKVYKQSDPRSGFWDLSYPDGSIRRNYADEQAAWEASPNWQANAEAAIALSPSESGVLLTLSQLKNGKWQATYWDSKRGIGADARFTAEAKVPAEAVCEAWLMWRAASRD